MVKRSVPQRLCSPLLEYLRARPNTARISASGMNSLPTIVVINFAQGSDLVWPTGTFENLFLYLSTSAAEFFSKTAHFDVELRKSG